MILKNIAKDIQQKLKSKELALSKKPVVANQTSDYKTLNFSDMASRAIFVRMVSNKKDFEIIQGGDLLFTTELGLSFELNVKTKFGHSQVYEKKSDGQIRGISGIKNISVEYKGGYKGIRRATVNWTANSLDDLNRFEQHFLTNGVSVLLEWGWVYKNEKLNVKETFYRGPDDSEGPIKQQIFDYPSELILDNKGDFDAMGGVISNFDYKLNEDGGFDCTTIISSVGIDFFSVNEIRKDITNIKLIGKKPSKDNLLNCIINLNDVIVYDYLGYNYGVDWRKAINLSHANGVPKSAKMTDENKSLIDIDGAGEHPTCFIKRRAIGDENKYEVVCVSETSAIYKDSPFLNAEIFVRWGWFEDNILSRYTALEASSGGKLKCLFRSVESEIGDDGRPTDNEVGVKISNSPFLLPKNLLSFILTGHNINLRKFVDINEIAAETEGNEQLMEIADETSKAYEKLLQINSGTNYKFSEIDDKYGNLRNIMINTREIQKAFGVKNPEKLVSTSVKEYNSDEINPPETLNAAMKNLLQQLNDNFYKNWEFEIVEDPYKGNTKIVDLNSSSNLSEDRRTYTKFKGDSYLGEGEFSPESEEVENLGIYSFPSFKTRSIVKSQELEFKIPDAQAYISMYGKNIKDLPSGSFNLSDEDSSATGLLALDASYRPQTEDDLGFNNIQPLYELATEKKGHTTGNSNLKASVPLPPITKVDSFELNHYAKRLWRTFVGQPEVNATKETSFFDLFTFAAGSSEDVKQEYLMSDRPKNMGNIETALENKKIENCNQIKGGPGYRLYAFEKVQKTDKKWEARKKYGIRMIDGVAPLVNARIKNIHRDNFSQFKDYLIPAELSLEVDGTGGIYPSEIIHVDYITDKYKENLVKSGSNGEDPSDYVGPRTFFQIFNVTQTVDENGWTTSLQTKMRFNSNTFGAMVLPELPQVEEENPFPPKDNRDPKELDDPQPVAITEEDQDPIDFYRPPDKPGSAVIPDARNSFFRGGITGSAFDYGNTREILGLNQTFDLFDVPVMEFEEYPEVDEPGSAVIPDSSEALTSEAVRNSLTYGNTKDTLSLSQAFDLSYTKLDLNDFEDDDDREQNVEKTKTPEKSVPLKDVYTGSTEQNRILYAVREDLRPLYFKRSESGRFPNWTRPTNIKASDLEARLGIDPQRLNPGDPNSPYDSSTINKNWRGKHSLNERKDFYHKYIDAKNESGTMTVNTFDGSVRPLVNDDNKVKALKDAGLWRTDREKWWPLRKDQTSVSKG